MQSINTGFIYNVKTLETPMLKLYPEGGADMKMLLAILFVGIAEFALCGDDKAISLKGSTDSLAWQNKIADEQKLPRVSSDKELEQLKKSGVLIQIPEWFRIDPRLDQKWRWVLPETAKFLDDFGVDFINHFGRYFKTTSAIRTTVRQLEIAKEGNPNAELPMEGPRRTSHTTGATIDISKIDMNEDELAWTRKELLRLEKLQVIEATEEDSQQKCFHIMVFKTYAGYKSQLNAQ